MFIVGIRLQTESSKTIKNLIVKMAKQIFGIKKCT